LKLKAPAERLEKWQLNIPDNALRMHAGFVRRSLAGLINQYILVLL
jgi:hypothetical protein